MKRLLLFFVALAAFAGLHAQQDPTNLIQEFTIKIDNLGDADYTLTQKMTQQQWTNFKQSQLANDPAIARRDLQRAMSASLIEELSDNAFMLTSNAMFGNQLTQQIFKVFFPSGASSLQQSTDAFNKAIFTYKNSTLMATIFQWNYIVGALLILGAISTFILSFRKDNKIALSKIVVHAPQKTGEQKNEKI